MPGTYSRSRKCLATVAIVVVVGSIAIGVYGWHLRNKTIAWQAQFARLDATICTLYRSHTTDMRDKIWNNAIDTLTDGLRNVCLNDSVSIEEMRILEERICERLRTEPVTIATVKGIRMDIVSINEAAAEYDRRHRRYVDEVYQSYEQGEKSKGSENEKRSL